MQMAEHPIESNGIGVGNLQSVAHSVGLSPADLPGRPGVIVPKPQSAKLGEDSGRRTRLVRDAPEAVSHPVEILTKTQRTGSSVLLGGSSIRSDPPYWNG